MLGRGKSFVKRRGSRAYEDAEAKGEEAGGAPAEMRLFTPRMGTGGRTAHRERFELNLEGGFESTAGEPGSGMVGDSAGTEADTLIRPPTPTLRTVLSFKTFKSCSRRAMISFHICSL